MIQIAFDSLATES